LDCYAFEGVPKGKEYCDLTFVGTDTDILTKRVECYDSLFIKNKARCDAKRIIESMTKSEL
jgi:hypothetical protein